MINKTTVGFVIQVFDPETRKFVSQEFVVGDQVDFEDDDRGEPVEPFTEYLCFDMEQPVLDRHELGDLILKSDDGGYKIGDLVIKTDNEGCASIVFSGLKDESGEDAELYNTAIDGIESLMLALAAEGVNISSQKFRNAMETAVQACANNL